MGLLAFSCWWICALGGTPSVKFHPLHLVFPLKDLEVGRRWYGIGYNAVFDISGGGA